MADNQGFGGGRAGRDIDDNYALDKPYDLNGDPSADKMQQIDEMLNILFKSMTRAKAGIDSAEATVAGLGTGDVVGPASAVSGDVAIFNGATGKLLADGGTLASLLLGAGFLIATLKLSTAQLDALAGTPITIVAAQGANKLIGLVSAHTYTTRSGAWSVSPTFRFQYNGSTTPLTNTNPGSLLASAGAGTATGMSAAANITSAAAFANTAIEVTFSADTAPGAQTATAWIVVACVVLDVT